MGLLKFLLQFKKRNTQKHSEAHNELNKVYNTLLMRNFTLKVENNAIHLKLNGANGDDQMTKSNEYIKIHSFGEPIISEKTSHYSLNYELLSGLEKSEIKKVDSEIKKSLANGEKEFKVEVDERVMNKLSKYYLSKLENDKLQLTNNFFIGMFGHCDFEFEWCD